MARPFFRTETTVGGHSADKNKQTARPFSTIPSEKNGTAVYLFLLAFCPLTVVSIRKKGLSVCMYLSAKTREKKEFSQKKRTPVPEQFFYI